MRTAAANDAAWDMCTYTGHAAHGGHLLNSARTEVRCACGQAIPFPPADGDAGFCPDCGGPVRYDGDQWVHDGRRENCDD